MSMCLSIFSAVLLQCQDICDVVSFFLLVFVSLWLVGGVEHTLYSPININLSLCVVPQERARKRVSKRTNESAIELNYVVLCAMLHLKCERPERLTLENFINASHTIISG